MAYVKISAAGAGNNTLIAAQTGQIIRVHAFTIVAAGAVTVDIQSGATGTSLTGVMSLAANGGMVVPYCAEGWFQTAAATLLNMSLGGATQVSGFMIYHVVGGSGGQL